MSFDENQAARAAESARDADVDRYHDTRDETSSEDRKFIDAVLFDYDDRDFILDLAEYLCGNDKASLTIREKLQSIREWENLGMHQDRHHRNIVDAAVSGSCITSRMESLGCAVYEAFLKNTGELDD